MSEQPLRAFDGGLGGGDPDLDAADPDLSIGEPSALEALREELASELEGDLFAVPVPARPGYELRCATGIRYEQLAGWRKSAGTMHGGLNELRFACILLANQTRQIVRQDEPVTLEGQAVTFASKTLHELLGVERAVDAVRKLFGRDADVMRACKAVADAAGYGGAPAEAPDPTQL